MELPPHIVKRLTRELQDLVTTPPEGIRVLLNEQNLLDVTAEMEGPIGTPFEGGVFRLRLTLPSDWPGSPPKGYFCTKVFHPNVSAAGDICVNVLKKDWTSETTLRHVFMVIRCLLIQPFPDSALNEEAGKLLLEDYEEYDKRARLMTSIHAMCAAKRPGPLTTSGANAGGTSSSDTTKKEGAPESSSPTLKKAKSEQSKAGASTSNSTMAKVKKGLKRL